MSVQSEITRIQTARNTLRAKAVNLGIGLSTDNLTQLATKYDAMVNRGAVDAEVKEGETYTVPAGYHNGSGVVKGVAGGGNYNLQAKTAIPTKSQQSIAPDSGYYGLSTVTVNPIPDAYQDVTDVTAVSGDVLATKVFVTSTGVVTTGTMQNRGAISATLDTGTTSYTVPSGYHNGSGKVSITTETKSATPSTSSQTIEPTDGKVLSAVTVNPIPSKYGDASGVNVSASDLRSGKTAIGYNSATGSAVTVSGSVPTKTSADMTIATHSGGVSNKYIISALDESFFATDIEIDEPFSCCGIDYTRFISSARIRSTSYYYLIYAGSVEIGTGIERSIYAYTATKVGEGPFSGQWLDEKYRTITIPSTSTALLSRLSGYITLADNIAVKAPTGIYDSDSYKVLETLEGATIVPVKAEQEIETSGKYLTSNVIVSAIPNNYADATEVSRVDASAVLTGKTYWGWEISQTTGAQEANKVIGTMPNIGAVSQSLNCGQSYTVPNGYHNGSGTVTANSLASQTGVDTGKTAVTAATMLIGHQGWVNGTKISGTMANNGAISKTLDTTTTSYSVPGGYTSGGTVGITLETKSVTPTTSSQNITPTAGKVLSNVTVGAIPSNYVNASTVDAASGNVLSGKKAVVKTGTSPDTWEVVSGTMVNNGAVTQTLNCGQSYTIPVGYHNGSGTVTANSLASQTGVDSGKTAITAATVLAGYQGWVNGAKVSGSMANRGAVTATLTGLGAVAGDTSYTIPAGYHNGSGTVSLTMDIENALAAI